MSCLEYDKGMRKAEILLEFIMKAGNESLVPAFFEWKCDKQDEYIDYL